MVVLFPENNKMVVVYGGTMIEQAFETKEVAEELLKRMGVRFQICKNREACKTLLAKEGFKVKV